MQNIETQYYTFAEPPYELKLKSGEKLGPITLAYETYGELNKEKSNAILVFHALTGDAHAAGLSKTDKKPGWWDNMIGPGKAFDTDKYFIICANCLGSCKGTTGPASVNPKTGKPYGLSFPVVTIEDMVVTQKHLIDHLGISKLLAVTGGSMGGLEALKWSLLYPDSIASTMAIATNYRHTAQQIALHEVSRQAIMADPDWHSGNYYGKSIPARGLSVSRMIGHITYMSEKSMDEKFGRKLIGKEKLGYDFSHDFEVESYLKYRGDSFVQRFDANSYLYLSKALDYFDLSEEGSLKEAFAKAACPYLVVSFSSDWLYPPNQSKEMVKAMKANGLDVSAVLVDSSYGHDAFLLEVENLSKLVTDFLEGISQKAKKTAAAPAKIIGNGTLRLDHQIVCEMITPNSKVLDLGCGDGTLLSLLIKKNSCKATGIEIDEKAIYKCLEKGLTVSHGDIDTGMADFSSKRFDFVILSESLQQVLHPKHVILEALRVGKKVIVAIPNFCNTSARLQIFFKGIVPVTKELPHQWYDTPNLRFLSLKDFRKFCRKNEITILQEKGIAANRRVSIAPNLFANIGIYLLEK